MNTGTGEKRMTRKLQAGECSCTDCQSACKNVPGWFLPNQIAPLAKAMGLTVQQLFKKHLQINWWEDTPNVFVLAPRLTGHKGGTMYPGDPTGTCHWFKNGKCAIHKLGKPAECQQLGHAKRGGMVKADHEHTADAWRAPKHQKMIRTLYGQEPEAAPYHGGFGSIFSSIFGGF